MPETSALKQQISSRPFNELQQIDVIQLKKDPPRAASLSDVCTAKQMSRKTGNNGFGITIHGNATGSTRFPISRPRGRAKRTKEPEITVIDDGARSVEINELGALANTSIASKRPCGNVELALPRRG